MRINLSSVYVHDQTHALHFYTDILGFVKMADIPFGEVRWLTVVSPENPTGTELVLEPADDPVTAEFRASLVERGIPFNAFAVDDVRAEHARLTALGVVFTLPPVETGPIVRAIFDDTCGNLIQIYQLA